MKRKSTLVDSVSAEPEVSAVGRKQLSSVVIPQNKANRLRNVSSEPVYAAPLARRSQSPAWRRATFNSSLLTAFAVLLCLFFSGTAWADELTIYEGDGSTTNGYVPVYGFYADAYLKCEFVYPASELSAMTGGTISAMKFYASQSSVSWGSANFKVYLKEISGTSISSFGASDGTLVYDGLLSIVNGEMSVNFTTDFSYSGGNLLVGVYNTVEGDYVTSSWYGETVTGASVQGYSYDGLSSVSPTQRDFLPKTTFTYTSCQIPASFALVADSETSSSADVSWSGSNDSYIVQYAEVSSLSSSVQNVTILEEGFAGNGLPAGWNNTTSNWSVSSSNYAGSTANEVLLSWSPQIQNGGITRLITPACDLRGIDNVTFSFKHYLDYYDNSYTTILGIATSSDNGSTWNTGWSNTYTTDVSAETVSRSITTTDMGNANVLFCIYFEGDSYGFDNWYFDDIRIVAEKTVSEYDWQTASSNATSPYTIGGLDAGTDYLARIIGVCNGNQTAPSDAITFTTLASASATHISTEADWNQFCMQVNGCHDFHGETVYLDADISPTSNAMVGTESCPFRGTFNGQGYKITVSIENTADQGVAPFHYIDGATIKNLEMGGTVSAKKHHAAGLVGFCASGSTNVIQNCLVHTNVTNNNSGCGDDTNNYMGGLIGHNMNATTSIIGCVYDGTLTSQGFKGGMVGFADNGYSPNTVNITIKDCYFGGNYSANGYSYPNFSPVAARSAHDFIMNLTSSNFYYNTDAGTFSSAGYSYEGNNNNSNDLGYISPKHAYTVTGDADATVAMRGASSAAYNVSGITAYNPGIVYNGTIYGGDNETLPLSLGYTGSEILVGYEADNGTLSGTAVTGTNDAYTIVMPTDNVIISPRIPCPEVVVGDHSGTATNGYLPSYPLYNYSLTQQIYTPCEIGTAGTITSIAFKNTTTAQNPIYDIYLVHTSKSAFSSSNDWIAVTSSDKVYSGTVTMTEGVWTTIEFDTPFSYNGTSNLAVIIDDNIGSWSGSMSCLSYSVSDNQSLYVYDDYTNFDPTNPTSYTGTLLAVKNQIKFGMCDKSTPSGSYTISASASGSGTVEGAGTYTRCSDVTMTATPTGCNSFVSWTEGGDVVSTNATYSFKASSNRTLVANFEAATLSLSSSPAVTECLSPETEVVLTAISGAPSPTYTWSYEGTEGSASGGTYTVSPTALTNTYTVSISECGLSQTVTVTTKPAITSVTSTAGDAACEGSDVTLNVVSSNATGYLWSEDAGTTASVTVRPEVSTTYYVTVSGGDCTTVGSVGVTVKRSPTITASPDPAATCLDGSTQVVMTANDEYAAPLEDYVFETGTSSGVWITLSSPSYALSGYHDDDASSIIDFPDGFTFKFGDNNTRFWVNSNGVFSFSSSTTTGTTSGQFNSSNNNTAQPKISGIACDLGTGNGGYVKYELTGTAPNRVFVCEYAMGYTYGSSYTPDVTWQVQLYEADNKVVIVYGSSAPGTNPSGYQIGLGVSGSDFWTIDPTTQTATHRTSYYATTISNSYWPGANRYYSFTPPATSFEWAYTGTQGVASDDTYTVTPASATNTYTVTNTATGCSYTKTVDILTASNITVTGESEGVVTATCGVPLELEASGFSESVTYTWYSNEACTSEVSSTVNSSLSTENTPYYIKVSAPITDVSAGVEVYEQTFEFTGAEQTYTIPSGIDYVKLEVWGAQGGTYSDSYQGGKGGYSVGYMNVTPGDELMIYVGGQPEMATPSSGTHITGGYNGGGNGHTNSYDGTTTYGQGGGGATDVRVGGNTLYDRVIVAGGGSGSTNGSSGWAGGGASGLAYSSTYLATQASAGSGGNFGQGGNVVPTYSNYRYCSAGGGGGWYGGGANSSYSDSDATYRQQNGGGSGYVWTSATASSAPSGYNVSADYYLANAETIAGDSEMPTHDGSSTMTGNEGNGYARITCYAYGQCIAKKPVTVNIDKPSVSIPSLSDQTICSYESFAQLSVTPSASNGELSYSWSKDDVGFDNDGATYSPTTAGAYAVTVASTLGTCSVEQSRSATLAINSPSVSISAFSNQTICAYENFAQLNAEPTAIAGTASYEWTKDGEEFSNDNATYSPTAAGTYAVTVTSTIGTCTAKQNTSAVLANYSTPVPTLVTDHPSLCLGDEAILTAGGAGTGGSYDWGSGFSDETTHTVSPTSNTDYTVVVKNSDGCTASKVLTQAVQQAPGNVPATSVTRGHIWTGRVSSDWNDSRNWVVFTGGGSGYTIAANAPTANDQVVVRTGATCINNEPSVNANSTASNVILRNGRTLTVNENRTLTVSGDINVESGAELAFSGSGTVSVSGDATIANGASVTFGNKDTLNVAGAFELNGSLAFPDSDTTPALRLGGNLTINNGSSLGTYGTLVFAGNGPQVVENNTTDTLRVRNNVRLNMHHSRAGVPHTEFPDGTIFSKATIFEYGIMDGDVIFDGTGRAIVCGGYESYASGRIEKRGSGNKFTFPTGDDNVLGSVTATISSGKKAYAKFHHWSGDNGDGSHGFGLDVIPRWWNVADMCSDDPEPFNHVSNFEYWDVSSREELSDVMLMTNAATSAEHFGDESAFVDADIQVAAYKNGCWSNYGGTATISDPDHNVIIIEGARIPIDPHRAAADFLITLGSKSNATVLPIELASVTATCDGRSTLIEWTTATERNNDYFSLERSDDAINFTEIARVAGAGNSIDPVDYAYTDYGIHGGDNYYRLVQVDYDGTRTESEIIVVNCIELEVAEPDVQAYPNPFNDELTVVLDNFGNRAATIEVYDMLGKLVYTNKIAAPQNSYETILNLSNLPPAAYTVRVSTNDFVINKNVVKN